MMRLDLTFIIEVTGIETELRHFFGETWRNKSSVATKETRSQLMFCCVLFVTHERRRKNANNIGGATEILRIIRRNNDAMR